jgi:indolepyruvate ferredoxin oxidoreductase alpha subunit
MMTYQLTGDEALAQGVWEAGVRVATGYPGSPSTRFLEHLAEISDPKEIYAQWSANEKVAFEMALGVSMAGKRAAVSFKSVGLNVAMDPLMVANLGGVAGGLVVIVGDDPGAWGSQNEQDGRLLIRSAEVPLLEFSSPQEAYDMAKYAFSLSERFELPVFIRETRSSAGARGAVHVEAERIRASKGTFAELKSWKLFPVRPTKKHGELHAKAPRIVAEFNHSSFNRMALKSDRGIVGAGYMAAKVSALVEEKGSEGLSIFKLGTVYPPPEGKLMEFLSHLESVLVAEELQPMIEQYLRSLAQRHNLKVRVFGKETGHLPKEGELSRDHLLKAIQESLEIEISPRVSTEPEGFAGRGIVYRSLPVQCPYYQAFEAFSTVLPRDPAERPILVGDDGCLIRLMNQPFSLLDCKFCMGSAIGLASGLALAGEKSKIIALVGDSSFFHTGLPAYMNAAASGVGIMIVVLDNRCTAMTGCQGNPGTDFNLQERQQKRISMEAVLKSAGIKVFRSVEAFGEKAVLAAAFRECLASRELAVLLVTGPCPNLTEKVCH